MDYYYLSRFKMRGDESTNRRFRERRMIKRERKNRSSYSRWSRTNIYIYIGKIIDFSFPGFKRFSDVKGHGSRITVSETSRGVLKNSVKVRIKGTGEERMMRGGGGRRREEKDFTKLRGSSFPLLPILHVVENCNEAETPTPSSFSPKRSKEGWLN